MMGIMMFLMLAGSSVAQRQMEWLDRGVVAMTNDRGHAVIGWRLLASDSFDVGFHLYRAEGKKKPKQLNKQPIIGATFYIDSTIDLKKAYTYFVSPALKGKAAARSAGYPLQP